MLAKKPATQILVIDDDSDIAELITAVADGMNLTCTATQTVADFMAMLNPQIQLLMIDLMMPDIDGVELLRILAKAPFKNRIILMSGADTRVLETAEALASSLGLSVVAILHKPFRVAELETIFKTHIRSDALTSRPIHSAPAPTSQKPAMVFTKPELQAAIDREAFVLYYQPQIDITTGRLVGLEALVRWQHPEHGLIYPDAFISQAESLGLIDQLGWLVAKRGLSEIKQFTREDGTLPTLSLNVSPYSLHDITLPDTFNIIAKKNEVAPENIILEITESGLFRELTTALDILTRLRMKQFKLSIDDFGTGYAMIKQLQHVPATELKIDKSLVQDMQDSTRIIIRNIIDMGHELGMKVIAEGVENAAQLAFLQRNHCDTAQGYLFSRPLPVSQLLAWIKHYNKSLS